MKFRILLWISAASLSLAGCGGSSGGVGSTPAPPPSNNMLTNLQVSQSFTNDAATQTVTWDVPTKTGINGSAKGSSLTVSYDARTKGYSLSVDGRSQGFGTADILSSDAKEAIYAKSDATGSDRLTLVKTPYTGTAPTQYVGLGYWQHNVVNGSRQDTDFVSFTYGLPTAAGAVPRTGTAGFTVDAFGLVSAPGAEPRSFQGRGDFSVDFGAGIFSTDTYLTETALVTGGGTSGGGIDLIGAGHLSSTNGTFSGNALYEGWFGQAGGTLNGRFYGPNAQELGATFSGANASGMTFSGSFTGQLDSAVQPDNLTLTNMTKSQLFYTQFGGGQVGQLNRQNSETFTFATPTSDLLGGQFTINDKVPGDSNFTTYRKSFSNGYETQDVKLELYRPGAANSELALTYASFGHWSTTINSGVNSYPVDRYFTYGLETPARLLMGKTGAGRYQGVVYGAGVNSVGARYDVRGTSQFDVDFSAQSYSGALNMNGTAVNNGASVDLGRFDFAGNLAGYTAGTTVSMTQGGLGAGEMQTRFFGPDGEEIAGTFSVYTPLAAPGAGYSVSGVTVAKRQ